MIEKSNFYLQFRKSHIFKVISLDDTLLFKWRKVEKKIFFRLTLLSLIFFFITGSFSPFFGFSLLFGSLFLIAFLKDLFFETKLKNFKRSNSIFDKMDFLVAKALFKAFRKSNVINSSIFLYFLFDKKTPKIIFIFSRLIIPIDDLKKQLLNDKEKREDLPKLFNKIGENKEKITMGDVLFEIANENEILKRFLIKQELKPEDLKSVSDWFDFLEKEYEEGRKFWKFENLVKIGSLGREWTFGYTILLDRYSIDITKFIRLKGFSRVFTHEKERKLIERILASPDKNDVLIVGEKGTGKRSIIEALAKDIYLGQSLPELNFKRVVLLDLTRVIANSQSIENAEKVIDTIFQEVALAGNVILVIDNIHQYIGVKTQRTLGVVEISGILSFYLPFPNFRCIAITTPEGLHRNLEQNFSFLSYFEKVEVKEVTKEENLKVLQDRALILEKKYKVFFPYIILKNIVLLCEKYLPLLTFPEKAIDVVDELAVFVSQKGKKIVSQKDLEEVVERKAKIPIGKVREKEKVTLLKLEELLHQRVIDQEEAVKQISDSLRRGRTEVSVRKGTIGNFLFLGPTGVGKTETAKALAEIYFGSEKSMIRLDMSEFQNLSDIPRLLGGEDQEGSLSTSVRENPFSLILLDEFEKANSKILNLFLQVFDEGHLTDGRGRKVFFKNTIIIATSNAGAEIIWQMVENNTPLDKIKETLISYLIQNKIFTPELLNRFDGIIVFKPLTKENLLQIAELILKRIQKNLKENSDIEFVITEDLKEKIVELSYDPKFGAREMQRVINEKVGNSLAVALLSGKIKRGMKIEIDSQNFEIRILN